MTYYAIANENGQQTTGTLTDLWCEFELGDYNEDLTDYTIDMLLTDINDSSCDCSWFLLDYFIHNNPEGFAPLH